MADFFLPDVQFVVFLQYSFIVDLLTKFRVHSVIIGAALRHQISISLSLSFTLYVPSLIISLFHVNITATKVKRQTKRNPSKVVQVLRVIRVVVIIVAASIDLFRICCVSSATVATILFLFFSSLSSPFSLFFVSLSFFLCLSCLLGAPFCNNKTKPKTQTKQKCSVPGYNVHETQAILQVYVSQLISYHK